MTAPALATAALDAASGQISITEPGVYDITNSQYHSDPVPGGSLSSSGARKLIAPSCPALFKYERENPPAPKDTFDFGSAAHTVVLGKGDQLAIIDASDWKTKAAREERDEAREEGKIPILFEDYLVVEAMAAQIRNHEFAAKLLAPAAGSPERALFWKDGSIWRRALLDWLRDPRPDRRTIITDYKTARAADEDSFAKDMANYGYHQQADWYIDAVKALGLDGNGQPPVFLFIVQEKKAPYLVNVIQPDPTALAIGAYLNREALRTYKECTASGVWPGYGNEPKVVSLPAYVERQFEKEAWNQ